MIIGTTVDPEEYNIVNAYSNPTVDNVLRAL